MRYTKNIHIHCPYANTDIKFAYWHYTLFPYTSVVIRDNLTVRDHLLSYNTVPFA